MTTDSGADLRAQAGTMVSDAFTAMETKGWSNPGTLPEVEAITTAPSGLRGRCILLAAAEERYHRADLLTVIAREPAGLTLSDALTLLLVMPQFLTWSGTPRDRGAAEALVKQVEDTSKALDDHGRSELRASIIEIAPHINHTAAARRLRRLAASGAEIPYDLLGTVTEAGKALRAALEVSAETAGAKSALLTALTGFPAAGKPGRTWQPDSATAIAALGNPAALVGSLLDAALGAADTLNHRHAYFVTQSDEAFLCGLALLAGQVSAAARDPELLPRLRRLALKSVVMLGPYGPPRSIRLANHCVTAMADAGLPASVTELLTTERGTRHGSLLRAARAAIVRLAAAQGITRDELLEMAVEDHGLSPDGTRRVPLSGGWTAVIAAGALTAAAGYEAPDGQSRTSPPKTVTRDSAAEVGAVRKTLKAVRTTIGNERARLDAMLAADRSWPLDRWRELYLGHPVTGQLTGSLIWTFGDAITGIPVGTDAVLTSDGTRRPLPDGDGTGVRLWHPVHADSDEVRAWRQLLIDRRIVQPVKQAFREVYVLTPAEEATVTYSNRFAGHVFRQGQARALMKGRGWKPVPLAPWDDGIDHGTASRDYPDAGGQALRAEFFFDYADDEHDRDLFTYCASDQVRFADARGEGTVPLARVPPRVFSEAMRDVDLFIGVTSVGADPEWNDHGEGRRFVEYWRRFAFGDLGAGARVRREVLAGLVPLLAIAGRCELEDRFLRVRGDLRTYRIHLGSGNILMSPDDQYLCIVSARDARAGKLFLPFDDDHVLSVILSKAFLLAEDSKITDSTITRQIGGR